MTITSQTELISVLERGEPEAILGTNEQRWLDFKTSGYRLESIDAKLELAKDVTALANSGGGYIVLGVETVRESTSKSDVANKIRPVSQQTVNPDQYRKCVKDYTYPPIRDLELNWWCVVDGNGILTIRVEPIIDGSWPVMITRARIEGSKRSVFFGIAQRHGEDVDWVLASELHSMIQKGRLVERLGVPVTTLDQRPTGPTPPQRAQRLDQDVNHGGFAGRRRYFLQAWPGRDVRVKDMYRRDIQGIPVVLSLHEPLRPVGGFTLRTIGETTVLPGGVLRRQDSKMSLSLDPSGLLTWIVSADSDFLAWADERRGRPKAINPISLIESTYEFCRLYSENILQKCEPKPESFVIDGGLSDLNAEGVRSSIEVSQDFSEISFADAPSSEILLPAIEFRKAAPPKVAYRILEELYGQFGFHNDHIPYAKDGELLPALIGALR